MTKGTILVLKEEDLSKSSSDKNIFIEDIDIENFKKEVFREIPIFDVVLFIAKDGQSRIIKFRF